MNATITIIGAGAIGRWTALYAAEMGFHVHLIERGSLEAGCSFGNAGMIVPSHVIPLAAPGMISQGMRWMFRASSPFYVRPRISNDLIQWGRLFVKNATETHVENSKESLRDLSLLSKSLYEEWSTRWPEIAMKPSGLMMLYQTEKVGEEERHAAEIAKKMGLSVRNLNHSEAQEREPNVRLNALGGILYETDGLIDPERWMKRLEEELRSRNVEFHEYAEVVGIQNQKGQVTRLELKDRSIPTEAVVVAAGAWSASVTKLFGESLHVLPGKGYSFKQGNTGLQQASILCEGKVAVSPFASTTRFGGTLEITHTSDLKVRPKRLGGIVKTVNDFYPDLKIQAPQIEDVWQGYRPCAPDGLPYIGRSEKWSNVYYATGHGMMGISSAPATGKLIVQTIRNEAPDVFLTPFRINRF